MAKILINGDSWACGEWYDDSANNRYIVTHTGLEYYLSDNHQITNIGLGRSSNLDALERFKKLNYLEFDYIFWFLTEPLRDINDRFDSYSEISLDELLYEQKKLSSEFYSEVNKLNARIYFLGGAGRIDESLILNFNNLISYIPCITEFLFADYKQPFIWQNPWFGKIAHKVDLESLEQLVLFKKVQDQLLVNNKYANYFQPDGRHPNRYGHYLLYQKIKKDFNL